MKYICKQDLDLHEVDTTGNGKYVLRNGQTYHCEQRFEVDPIDTTDNELPGQAIVRPVIYYVIILDDKVITTMYKRQFDKYFDTISTYRDKTIDDILLC